MGAPTPSVRSPGGPRRAGELNGRGEALGEASNMQQAGSQPSIFLPFPSRTWSYQWYLFKNTGGSLDTHGSTHAGTHTDHAARTSLSANNKADSTNSEHICSSLYQLTNAHDGHLTIVRPLQRHMHNTCTPLPRHDPVPSTPRAEHSDFSEILNSYKL